jgi:hypothetical protein
MEPNALEAHRDPTSLEALKYNIISRRKGTLDFPRTVVGGLGYFEERGQKAY